MRLFTRRAELLHRKMAKRRFHWRPMKNWRFRCPKQDRNCIFFVRCTSGVWVPIPMAVNKQNLEKWEDFCLMFRFLLILFICFILLRHCSSSFPWRKSSPPTYISVHMEKSFTWQIVNCFSFALCLLTLWTMMILSSRKSLMWRVGTFYFVKNMRIRIFPKLSHRKSAPCLITFQREC